MRELDRLLDRAPRGGEVDADEPVPCLTTRPLTSTVWTSPRWAWKATCPYGCSSGNMTGESSFLISTTSAFLPASRLPTTQSRPQRPAAAARRPVDDLLGAQVVVGHRLLARVRLEVLARAVGAERAAHGREQVAAPPHARVHGQRDRDVVLAQPPGRRIALAGALLALRRDRHRPARRRDAVVGVLLERRGVDVDVLRRHEPVLVHEPDAVVVGRAPHAGVRGHGHAELARHLEGRLLGELGVAGDVEGHLEAEHVVARCRSAGRRSA